MVIGGHHLFMRVLVRSFEWVPPYAVPGGLIESGGLGAIALESGRMTGEAIVLGVELAIPVIGTVLLVNIGLALVNKAAPRLDVFFLGMPIKATAATLVVMLVFDALARKLLGGAASHLDVLSAMLQRAGGI